MAATTESSVVHDSVLASTLRRRAPGYITQVGSQCPFWYWMRKAKRYKPVRGGERIERSVEYALNTDEPTYHGYDTLNLHPTDDTTIVFANWKQYYKPIVISGREKRINSGMRIFDLLEQKEQNAITSLINQFNDDLYEDGTGNNSKAVVGLAAICAWAPTSGTLFGVNRANEAWWRNQIKNTNAAAWDRTNSEATMTYDMETLNTLCGRLKSGKRRYPDVVICTEAYYQYYCFCTEKIGRRFVNQKVADAGWKNALFNGTTIIPDEDCPNYTGGYAQGYWLNSEFLEMFYHPDANLTVTPSDRMPDQDAFAQTVLWMGGVICTNCAKQGVHFNITAKAA